MIAQKAIEGISRSPKSEAAVTRLMLLTQAITESPAVFALVVSLSLIFVDQTGSGPVYAAALFSSALCMGIGSLGPALSEGFAASKACEFVSKRPASASQVIKTLLVGMALTESVAVYALVISLCIMYFG
jgi:ATP synthase F0 subunit c